MKVRSVALVGHQGAGKTTLAEAILYKTGVTSRLGNLQEGTSVLAFHPEEVKRKISIRMSVATTSFEDHRIYLVDTPGFFDFEGEVRMGLSLVDNALVVVDATSGVDVGTERTFQFAQEQRKPRAFVVTKMGASDEVDWKGVVAQIREVFGNRAVPFVYPVGVGSSFTRVLPLLKADPETLPEDAQAYRTELLEDVVEHSEELMERYLADEPISLEELEPVIWSAMDAGELFPILFVDSVTGVGVEELLSFMVHDFPGPDQANLPVALRDGEEVTLKPEPDQPTVVYVGKVFYEPHLGELFVVRVFQGTVQGGMELLNVQAGQKERINQIYTLVGKERTEVSSLGPGEIGALVKLKHTHVGHTLTAPDFPVRIPEVALPEPLEAVAIVPQTKQDEEKVSNALHKLHEEDPTFSFGYEPELKQTVLRGLGETHLDVLLSRLREEFGVKVSTRPPRIPYRETIRKPAQGEGKYVKQTGGRGQYGWCFIRIEPLPRGGGYEWVDEIFGGAIPQNFRPAVEIGVKKAMETGVLAGVQVVDVKVTLYDGKYHPVDSSNLAFEIAGSLAFKDAEAKADPYLLEPVYYVEVTVPEEYMGDVIGELNARRGRILGMDAVGKYQKIRAHVPLAEMQGFGSRLRSLTKGRGLYTMRFDHYDEVPRDIATRVIAELKKEREEERS